MTGKVRQSERLVMMSSVIPSAKYSCSGSPLIFEKGNTAMAGGLSSVDLSSITSGAVSCIALTSLAFASRSSISEISIL